MAEDGGYYAIKGFRYHFDKAILDMLAADICTNIFVENIQDISTDSYVVQVKHMERAKLVPSALRKPIIGLIEEFRSDPQIDYILYSHFGDLNKNEGIVGVDGIVSISNLDKILGVEKDSFATKLKKAFLKKFRLDLSVDFQDQFRKVINKLVSEEIVSNRAEAIVCYHLIVNHIQKIISDNPDQNRRVFNKGSVLEMLDVFTGEKF